MLRRFLLHPPLQEVHLSALPLPPLQLRTWAKLPRGNRTFLIASMVRGVWCCFLSPVDICFWVDCWPRPAPLAFGRCNNHLFRRICTSHLACSAVHAYMLLTYVTLPWTWCWILPLLEFSLLTQPAGVWIINVSADGDFKLDHPALLCLLIYIFAHFSV